VSIAQPFDPSAPDQQPESFAPTSETAGPSRLAFAARGLLRPVEALRAVPHLSTYAGMGLVIAGALLLLFTWVKVAGLGLVWTQIPYLISSGCSGVCLVAIGLTVISVAAKTEDARRRGSQMRELHELLAELRQMVETELHRDTRDSA
jgi:hypothetical protein